MVFKQTCFVFREAGFGKRVLESRPHRQPVRLRMDAQPRANVAPTGVEFLTDEGDLLLTCEASTSLMRLFRLEEPNFGEVLDHGVIAEDCFLDVVRAADGTVYYSNQDEIRRLVVEPASQQ